MGPMLPPGDKNLQLIYPNYCTNCAIIERRVLDTYVGKQQS